MRWREKLEVRTAVKLTCALALIGASASASATLGVRAAYQNAALSIDAVTSTGPNDVKQVSVDTPAGASVLAAYLYVADTWGNLQDGDVTLNGVFLPTANGTLLTPNANPANTKIFDVTSILSSAINGTNGLQNFSYSEANGGPDGSVLVVVYRSAATNGTAILLDGELSTTGDTTQLDFSTPYAGGDVIMSLASSFSYNGPPPTGQVTTVDVTTSSTASRRLTSCAGGNDDGNFVAADGQLITAGGVGDNTANPDPNCVDGNDDDELYNLGLGNSANPAPFLNAGDTFVKFSTRNPTNDDNVFMLGFTTSFKISSVDDTPIPDQPPPTTVPEPTSLALLGLGLAGLAYRTRRGRKDA